MGQAGGKVKAVGVSNYTIEDLEELVSTPEYPPMLVSTPEYPPMLVSTPEYPSRSS